MDYYIKVSLAKNSDVKKAIEFIQENLKFTIIGTFREDEHTTRTADIVGEHDRVIFSSYHHKGLPEAEIVGFDILFRFKSIIDIGRRRATSTALRMTISVQILGDSVDTKRNGRRTLFNYLNALNDPELSLTEHPKNSISDSMIEKSASASTFLLPVLKCIVHVNPLSLNDALLTLELESAIREGAIINDISIEIPDAVVKGESQKVLLTNSVSSSDRIFRYLLIFISLKFYPKHTA